MNKGEGVTLKVEDSRQWARSVRPSLHRYFTTLKNLGLPTTQNPFILNYAINQKIPQLSGMTGPSTTQWMGAIIWLLFSRSINLLLDSRRSSICAHDQGNRSRGRAAWTWERVVVLTMYFHSTQSLYSSACFERPAVVSFFLSSGRFFSSCFFSASCTESWCGLRNFAQNAQPVWNIKRNQAHDK